MRVHIIRKILIGLIFAAPLVSYSGCKKQAKCGCEGDVLYTLTNEPSKVYFKESGSSIYFTPVNNPFSTYNFCNPEEMFSKFKNHKTGDVLLVSGDAYWECNYLYQSSNYSYQMPNKIYMIKVTNVTVDLYGKK